MKHLVSLDRVNLTQVHHVGGKNASLGEMLQHLKESLVNVPHGYATTTDSYRKFLSQHHLNDKIDRVLANINMNEVKKLNKVSQQIRQWIIDTPFIEGFEAEVANVLKQFPKHSFAIRSSATAEDLANASFAGQLETYLNVKELKNVLLAIKHVYASLFTMRAIDYRYRQGLHHTAFAMSVGIQPMVRSDKAASGVMFTLDTESGFDKVILINASYGLGEAIVQGQVNPDEFCVYKPALEQNRLAILERKRGDKALKMVFASNRQFHSSIKAVKTTQTERNKFCINDDDVHTLARYALLIEKHYGKPMDIEWAKDALTGELFIVQARPETVKSLEHTNIIEEYKLSKKGKVLAKGSSVGQKIGSGKARVIFDTSKIDEVQHGDVLVTDMTDPDWEPIMKKASAIVTNRGGRTCHAAIIARELGIPAIVGCHNATETIKKGQDVTVSCADGEVGYVYAEKIPFFVKQIAIDKMPKLPLDICINMGNPDMAFATQSLPNGGVGLARLEFIISGIGVHPNAVLKLKQLPKKMQAQVLRLTSAYANPVEYYVEKLREGIAKISAAFYPKQVIFRFSDFKTNEYANLIGGFEFEASEENPMIGFRGASRYAHPRFAKCFELECQAFKRVRDQMGLTNAAVMIPFVRTVAELKGVLDLMEKFGLRRGTNQLKVYMMCEVPSNVILAKEFLQHVDGFSIGSNDLTQLVLGIDRDSTIIAPIFDERNEAVKIFLHQVISECRQLNKYIGICGQGPSDHPDFAEWLMEEGIQSMSLNADTVVETWMMLAKQGSGRH